MDEPCEYDQSNGNRCSFNPINYNTVINRNKRGGAVVLMFFGKKRLDTFDHVLGVGILFGVQGEFFAAYIGYHRGDGATLNDDATHQ